MKHTSSRIAFLPLALFAILVIALAAAIYRSGDGEVKFAQHIGEAAPQTTLPLLGHEAKFTTSDWKTRPYIVNVFASWCVPCHAEHEQLMELAKDHAVIIGIAYKDKADAVHKFLAQDGNPFVAVAMDNDGGGGIDWGITGVPETFVVDAKGMIRFHYAGPMTQTIIEQQLLPLWRSLQK